MATSEWLHKILRCGCETRTHTITIERAAFNDATKASDVLLTDKEMAVAKTLVYQELPIVVARRSMATCADHHRIVDAKL